MSKYAIQGFTQGFLNSESEKIDREQEKADNFIETMKKLQLKSIEKEQEHYDKKEQAMNQMKGWLDKGDVDMAMGVFATMHDMKDAVDYITSEEGGNKRLTGDREAMQSHLQNYYDDWKTTARRPEWTEESLNDRWKYYKRNQTPFERFIKDTLGINDGAYIPSGDRGLPRNKFKDATAAEGGDRQAVEDNATAVEGVDYKRTGPNSMDISITGGTEGAAEGASQGSGLFEPRPKKREFKQGTVQDETGASYITEYEVDPDTNKMLTEPSRMSQSRSPSSTLSLSTIQRESAKQEMDHKISTLQNSDNLSPTDATLLNIAESNRPLLSSVMYDAMTQHYQRDNSLTVRELHNLAWRDLSLAAQVGAITVRGEDGWLEDTRQVEIKEEVVMVSPDGTPVKIKFHEISEALKNNYTPYIPNQQSRGQ